MVSLRRKIAQYSLKQCGRPRVRLRHGLLERIKPVVPRRSHKPVLSLK